VGLVFVQFNHTLKAVRHTHLVTPTTSND